MHRLLGRLSLSGKFLLLAVLALAMLAVPTVLHVQNTLSDLRQASREELGLQPATELLKLIRLTQQHRGLSNGALGGNADAARQRATVQQSVEASWAAAREKLALVGHPEDVKQLETLQQRFKALGEDVATKRIPASQSFKSHTELISEELSLLYDVAVDAELVLHPMATGYFLQDALLRSLPTLTETLGQMRRTFARLDVSSRSLFALIEPGSCFAGSLLELALACDRSYQLALPDDAARAPQGQRGSASPWDLRP